MAGADHPYKSLPNQAYWRRSVGDVPAGEVDPFLGAKFRIGRRDRVAAAGSCFAQHIGRYLQAAGSNYLVAEVPHTLLTAQAARLTGYGVFSARFGNIYTARQLAQMFERAYGRFVPSEDIWREGDRRFVDPFRPNIQPGGFNSEREYSIDRARHFAAVRQMFETLDVFVFTLGLTEAWRAKADGAVFPVCPGVSGGVFSAERHEFVNFGLEEVVSDIGRFFESLRAVNPRARMILTVSPVPLAATASGQHVLTATTYSKSVLRVACEMLTRGRDDIVYFPSYEIVASRHAGAYFQEDRRSVSEDGVAHVMRVFARHFMEENAGASGLMDFAHRMVGKMRDPPTPERALSEDAIRAAFQVMCDEEALDLPFK